MKKIIINIKGQLGNQMFQYACAKKLQYIYGGEIIINEYYMKRYCPKYFKNSLTGFELNGQVSGCDIKPPLLANEHNIIIRLLKKVVPNLYFSMANKFNSLMWNSDRIYKKFPDLIDKEYIYLTGYFQSTKYFNDIKSIIKNEFTPKQPLKEVNRNLYNRINSTESVCMTIRRGDFMNNVNKKKLYICNEEYFYKGIRLIKSIIPNAVLFIFSDDIEWCKANLNFDDNTFYESGIDDVWEKLRLMSACKHFIISNSTFSWWSQYLSKNPNKIVIAPSKWYNFGDNSQNDIYEEGWKLIEV
ncbi:alpha-1,2-fucosyltransferase [Clostridium butyricum]|uniref:alpha-1,2-fucosyltransferase n=1 Tax=Clostridium butyricum TaxID=1492 RepID=UPI0004268916|nr:alpha-1,2-fucosyltransferase [Clostridium butyricum]